MALVASLCCKNRDRRAIPVDECLEHCLSGDNYCGTPYELQAMFFAGVQDRGERLSTTSILDKCDRQEWYKRRQDYAVDPASLYAAQRGTLIHAKLEGYQHPRCVAEHRYVCELEGLGSFSCQPDILDPTIGTMSDYKSCAEVPVFDYPWPDHKMQLFINRWVVDHAHSVITPDGEVLDLTDHRLRWKYVPETWTELNIVYLAIKGFKRIAITRKEQGVTKDGNPKNVRVADTGDDEEIESFIRTRYWEMRGALNSDEPPALVEKYERQGHVLCNYCPFKSQCYEHEIDQEVKKRLEEGLNASD